MGMVGAGERQNDSMYSPQTSNMMARAVGLHSNAAASAPTGTPRLGGGGLTCASAGGRRADLLSMLGKGPKTGAPLTTSALTARLGQAGCTAAPADRTADRTADQTADRTVDRTVNTGLAERLAQAGLASPAAKATEPRGAEPRAPEPRAPVPEMQTELAALRADAEGLRGVIGSQAAEIRTLTGQLSEVATLRNEMAELRQQMRAVQLDSETERRQAPADAALIRDMSNLQDVVGGIQEVMGGIQEVVASTDHDALLEMLSAEVANACSACRAVASENTVEYSVENCPSVRGGPEDDAILSQALEGQSSSAVPAGEEIVLDYPMYTRKMDDMGAEVFMRRRTVHPETAQMSYTYVKVLGSYGNDTIQYVAGFRL